jgi:hypothetical protein
MIDPELTPNQIARLHRNWQRWQQIAHSCQPIDQASASTALKRLYHLLGYAAAPTIVVCPSPTATLQRLASLYTSGYPGKSLALNLVDFLYQHLCDVVASQPRVQLLNLLHQRIYHELHDEAATLDCRDGLIQDSLQRLPLSLGQSLSYGGVLADTIATAAYSHIGCLTEFCLAELNCHTDPKSWYAIAGFLRQSYWVLPFEQVCLVCDRPCRRPPIQTTVAAALEPPTLEFADGSQFNLQL